MTKEINMFDKTPRQIRCIANEYHCPKDDRLIRKPDLEVGQLYWIENLGIRSCGPQVYLYEILSKYGFWSYLFEELNPYDETAQQEKGFYRPEYVKQGAYHVHYGYQLLKELYEEGNLPTAVFVGNDSMVAGSKISDSTAYYGTGSDGIYGGICGAFIRRESTFRQRSLRSGDGAGGALYQRQCG